MTALSVAPSSLVAGASATYSVGFTASDAASTGGYIYLTEAPGRRTSRPSAVSR